MTRLVVKIIEILDGTPAVYGKRSRGQSAVEMALITPLLIVLFASMVEIGWFANNYLTLLDATRSGARVATGLQDTRSPLDWDIRASLVPDNLLMRPDDLMYRMPDQSGQDYQFRRDYRGNSGNNDQLNHCPPPQNSTGFYNEVVCQTIAALDPLPLRNVDGSSDNPDDRATDDVVVSAFAVDKISQGTDLQDGNGPTSQTHAFVVGRYPANANECQVDQNGDLIPAQYQERDPFDFNGNNAWDIDPLHRSPDPIVSGYQRNNVHFEELPGFDPAPADAAQAERQVGFSWFGNHRVHRLVYTDSVTHIQFYTGCIGSEWTIKQVETLVNLPGYLNAGTSSQAESRELMPSQGIVLVELFWEHKPLLNLPFFEPIFRVFRAQTTIDVWAAFPLPQVEPFIVFK